MEPTEVEVWFDGLAVEVKAQWLAGRAGRYQISRNLAETVPARHRGTSRHAWVRLSYDHFGQHSETWTATGVLAHALDRWRDQPGH